MTDPARKARMAELCGNQKQIHEAPVFLAWCADQSRLDRICRQRGYRIEANHVEAFLVAAVDVALAMQTAALAAESLGLGICYIGGIRNEPGAVVELLGLPPLAFPISGMTLGWPDVEPLVRPRLPLEAVLHWERYELASEQEALLDYDRSMIETGIYQGRQVSVPGVKAEVEDYGWREHTARRVSTAARPELRAALRRQGFGLD
jgi:FMN reductase (NADPH)